jgi:hypothetical protein
VRSGRGRYRHGADGRDVPRDAELREQPRGLPATFVIKLPAQDETVRGQVAIGYRSECAFYATVAARVDVPVPHCYHCDFDAETGV